jgi:hypothetical protein
MIPPYAADLERGVLQTQNPAGEAGLCLERRLRPLVLSAVDECINEFDLRAIAPLVFVDQNLCFLSRIFAQNALLSTPSVKNRLK